MLYMLGDTGFDDTTYKEIMKHWPKAITVLGFVNEIKVFN